MLSKVFQVIFLVLLSFLAESDINIGVWFIVAFTFVTNIKKVIGGCLEYCSEVCPNKVQKITMCPT